MSEHEEKQPETITVAIPTSLNSPTYIWVRRAVIAVALLGAFAFVVVSCNRSEVTLNQGGGDARVVTRFPLPDAQAPRQSQVGIELQPGYDGTLLINGTGIPETQLDGASDPTKVDPAILRQFGVRPNNRNRLFFTPGPGKVFTELPKGKVVITAQFHKDRQPGVDQGTASWTITVQ